MSVTAPVDVTVIGFEGNQFRGEIVPALQDVVQRGLIRIIDLVFVMKDVDGNITAIELDDVPPDLAKLLSPVTGETNDVHGLLSEGDVADIADSVEPGSSAAMLVVEQTWMNRLQEAVANANGRVMTHERIPAQVIEQALKSRAATAAEASPEGVPERAGWA